jgi:subtilisin family serine protease
MSRAAAAVLICLLMAAALLPAAALAQDQPRRTYIVTLDVPAAGQPLRMSRAEGRQRARTRAAETRRATARVATGHGVKPRHRYTAALSGFSAKLTAREAAALGRDHEVVSVRPARRVRPATQSVPAGIRRVNAEPGNGPAPNVDVDIAIIDTGIGPAGDELNVAGGRNCFDNPSSGGRPDGWEDADTFARHGTHVAGIAAARDNGKGIVGVAPGARLWAVRVFDSFGGDEESVLCGIDWAVQTRLQNLPDDETIDVINMSLEAQRMPFDEDCGPGDPDPMHEAVCSAVAAGITVVVAAGNSSGFSTNRRASTVVPAAYDNVITVAAMNEYDGVGGGAGSRTCLGSLAGPDDRFAPYSNYGPDVDIVAPGTCIRSTDRHGGGANTHLLTGTSQATPHVTGAVARYLADHPATSPAQMRQLVRAAGRLDWFPTSDPQYSGVDDTDAPNRVLDVAALQANDPDVRVWLSSRRVKVGGDTTRERVRVDLQRIGGWAGQAQLSLEGLPDAVGSATFDRPGDSLDGLAGLGARLTLDVRRDGPQGPQDLLVRAAASGAGPAGSRDLPLLVDRRGPRVSGLAPRFRGEVSLADAAGSAQVYVRWDIVDRFSNIRTVTLQRKPGQQGWRAIKGSQHSARVSLRPGQRNRFRVQSQDSLGNRSTSRTIEARLIVRDSDASSWQLPASGWQRRNAKGAQGGALLVANGATGSLRTTFTGRSMALVAPVGPDRGRLRLRIDGGDWIEVGLKRSRAEQRRVVLTRTLEAGTHLLEVRGLSGRSAVDALLIVR